MDCARHDLLSTTDLTVGEIAVHVGNYDHSHLTKDFVKTRGVTPAEYRERNRQRTPRRPRIRG